MPCAQRLAGRRASPVLAAMTMDIRTRAGMKDADTKLKLLPGVRRCYRTGPSGYFSLVHSAVARTRAPRLSRLPRGSCITQPVLPSVGLSPAHYPAEACIAFRTPRSPPLTLPIHTYPPPTHPYPSLPHPFPPQAAPTPPSPRRSRPTWASR